MTKRIRKEKEVQKKTEEVVEEIPETKESKTSKISEELLDEIDELLETNAEEFVKSYVQKGGE